MTSRTRSKPIPATCKALVKWLSLNLGRHSLGALTGTDWRALEAAVHILEMYVHSRDASLLTAFRIVVLQMQPTTREFAYHATAQLSEWHWRAEIWELAGLPPLNRISRCVGEARTDEERDELARRYKVRP